MIIFKVVLFPWIHQHISVKRKNRCCNTSILLVLSCWLHVATINFVYYVTRRVQVKVETPAYLFAYFRLCLFKKRLTDYCTYNYCTILFDFAHNTILLINALM